METVTEDHGNGHSTTYKIINGTAYEIDTPDEVVNILESALHTDRRLRLFYGDTDTPDFERIHNRKPEVGKDWGDENDTIGTIGRSTGTVKIPLLIKTSRSYGGGGIMCDRIIKIVSVANKRVLYEHPNYHQPEYTIGKPPAKIGKVNMRAEGYTAGVYADGENVANFKSAEKAQRWIDFMTCKRMSH